MESVQIQSSKEYSRFKVILGNRGINTSNLKKVENSIFKRDLTPFIPAVVNENMEIIDGQHRFINAKKNRRPFYYVVVPGIGIEEARLLNANMRTWKLEDYLQSFIDMKMKDYITVQQVMEDHGVALSVAIKWLHGNSLKDSGIASFRNGNFVVDMKRLELFEGVMKEISKIRKHLSTPSLTSSRELVSVMYRVINNPKYPKFLDKLMSFNQTIKPQTNIKDMMRQFDEIYNFRNKLYEKFI